MCGLDSLTQDWYQCLTFVNTVIKLQIPKKRGILDSFLHLGYFKTEELTLS